MTNVDDKVTSQMTGIGQDSVSGSSPSFGLSQSKGSSSLKFGRISENGEDALKWIISNNLIFGRLKDLVTDVKESMFRSGSRLFSMTPGEWRGVTPGIRCGIGELQEIEISNISL